MLAFSADALNARHGETTRGANRWTCPGQATVGRFPSARARQLTSSALRRTPTCRSPSFLCGVPFVGVPQGSTQGPRDIPDVAHTAYQLAMLLSERGPVGLRGRLCAKQRRTRNAADLTRVLLCAINAHSRVRPPGSRAVRPGGRLCSPGESRLDLLRLTVYDMSGLTARAFTGSPQPDPGQARQQRRRRKGNLCAARGSGPPMWSSVPAADPLPSCRHSCSCPPVGGWCVGCLFSRAGIMRRAARR